MQSSKIQIALKATELILTQTYEPQTELVDECLTSGKFSYDDIINRFKVRVDEGRFVLISDPFICPAKLTEAVKHQIFDWIPVKPLLAKRLIEHKAPVLENYYGYWWGRTDNETPICTDPIILKISMELEEQIHGGISA